MSEIPEPLASLIEQAKTEGYVIQTERLPLPVMGGYTTMVKISHPDNKRVEWTETGFPDFFDPRTMRRCFAEHKASAMRDWSESKGLV